MQSILGLRPLLFFLPIIAGALYGISMRLLNDVIPGFGGVMSVTYLFVVPAVVGFLTILLWPRDSSEPKRLSWTQWIFYPWGTVALLMAAAMATMLEGAICIIVWSPIALALSSVGGIIAGLTRKEEDPPRNRSYVLVTVAILPVVLAPLEQQLTPSSTVSIAETEIVIDAPAEVIWENIREVPAIAPEELEKTFVHSIGFPRPIEARLEGEGVGAVRYATFEGDVLFIETVTDWEPLKRLSFTIDPSADIPPTTFDEHVVVGGEYFDVLSGAYSLERIGEDRYILHLSSTSRLSTRFNWYTALWTDFFMSDIQDAILEVIKHRCEEGRM